MKPYLAVAGCLLAVGFPLCRLYAQQTAPRAPRAISIGRVGGYLGIGVAEIDDQRAQELKLSDPHGVEVKHLDDNSPASKAGLKVGDLVLEYNGERVEGVDQFIRLVRETPSNRTVHLKILRGGAPQTLTATIGSRKPMEFGAWTMPDMPVLPVVPEVPELPETPNMGDFPGPFFVWSGTSLGIVAESLNPQLADFFGVKNGVLVQKVEHNSRAEKAGIKAGDVIVRMNGEAVSTVRDVTAQVHRAGAKPVPVVLMRNHREMTLEVKPVERSRQQMEEDSETENL